MINAAEVRETNQAQGPMRQRGRGISLCTHRLIQDAENSARNVIDVHLREDQSELLIDLHYWQIEGLDGSAAVEPEDANHNSLE
eukprot:gene24751-10390_t